MQEKLEYWRVEGCGFITFSAAITTRATKGFLIGHTSPRAPMSRLQRLDRNKIRRGTPRSEHRSASSRARARSSGAKGRQGLSEEDGAHDTELGRDVVNQGPAPMTKQGRRLGTRGRQFCAGAGNTAAGAGNLLMRLCSGERQQSSTQRHGPVAASLRSARGPRSAPDCGGAPPHFDEQEQDRLAGRECGAALCGAAWRCSPTSFQRGTRSARALCPSLCSRRSAFRARGFGYGAMAQSNRRFELEPRAFSGLVERGRAGVGGGAPRHVPRPPIFQDPVAVPVGLSSRIQHHEISEPASRIRAYCFAF